MNAQLCYKPFTPKLLYNANACCQLWQKPIPHINVQLFIIWAICS
jgi:hypothetical protein